MHGLFGVVKSGRSASRSRAERDHRSPVDANKPPRVTRVCRVKSNGFGCAPTGANAIISDIVRPNPTRWRCACLRQYGLHALFLAILVLSAWLALLVKRASDQSRAVETLTRVYALVMYDYQEASPGRFDPSRSSNLPEWLLDTTHIDLLHTVVWVNLDSPAVTDETLRVLSLLPQLRVLHVSNTSITDAGLAELAHLHELEWLSLNTDLSDAALVHVGKLRSLRQLEISRAPITDSGLSELYGLRRLERLTLEEILATRAGVAQLRGRLIDCEVDH